MNSSDNEGFIQQRALRLVTLSVGFRLFGPRNIKLEGHSTGLNENGLAGRCNLVTGELPLSPRGLILEAILDLPKDRPFKKIKGELLHATPSWVPGFRYFLAMKFLEITPEDIDFLRHFIAWREADYFKPDKPYREWYIFLTSEQKVYGPLTSNEVDIAINAHGITPNDLIWYPPLGRWMQFYSEELDENFKWIGEKIRENYSTFIPAGSTDQSQFQNEQSYGRAEFLKSKDQESVQEEKISDEQKIYLDEDELPSTRRKRFIKRLLISIAILVLTALGTAYWLGLADPTHKGTLFRTAEKYRMNGERYLAIKYYDYLIRVYPEDRLAKFAQEKIKELLLQDLNERDRQMANSRLSILIKLPEEMLSKPEVICAIGDCYYRLGKYEEAIEYFKNAVKIDPLDGVYRYDLGTAGLRSRNYQMAIQYLNRPPAQLHRTSSYYLNAGLTHLALGQNFEAQNRFEEAMRLSDRKNTTERAIKSAWEKPVR